MVLDDHDRLRFIHDLYALNDSDLALHPLIPHRLKQIKARKLLVDVHSYCLMNNHYHLLLSEVVENGISRFMQKFNMGYAKYFNERYQRSGVLWQGKHKKVLISRLAHELYIPYYIHLNPLDFILPEWREGKVRNTTEALQYLAIYRWSSHQDYLGIKNFPSILQKDFLADAFGSRKRYERELADIVSNHTLARPSMTIES